MFYSNLLLALCGVLQACDVFHASCHAVVAVADCFHTAFVAAWAHSHSIPHFTITSQRCRHLPNTSLEFPSSSDVIYDVIDAICVHEGWNDVNILDATEAGRFGGELVSRLSGRYVSTVYRWAGSGDRDRDQAFDHFLQSLDHVTSSQTVVIGAKAALLRLMEKVVMYRATLGIKPDLDGRIKLREFLEQIHIGEVVSLRLATRKYKWVLVGEGLGAEDFPVVPLNSLFLLPDHPSTTVPTPLPSCYTTPSPHPCLGVSNQQMLEAKLSVAQDLVTTAFMTSGLVGDDVDRLVTCSPSADVTLARQTVMADVTRLWRGLGSRLQGGWRVCGETRGPGSTRLLGRWSTEGGLRAESGAPFLASFSNFGHRTLTVATVPARPFVMREDRDGVAHYTGFCIALLDELASILKFNYTIVQPADDMFGSIEDGSWNGMVGMVMRGEADLGVGPVSVTGERAAVVDFTTPFMEDGVGILTQQTSGQAPDMLRVFSPFRPQVWLATVGAMFVVGLSLFLIGCFSPTLALEDGYCKGDTTLGHRLALLSDYLWLSFSAYISQTGDPHPRSVSGRCVLGFWWLFTILMASTYTANLAAFLTVTIARKPINSLAELAAQSHVRPLFLAGSNLETLFATAEVGIYRAVARLMEGTVHVASDEEALALVRQGGYAYLSDYTVLDHVVKTECKDFALADEIFNTAGLAFILEKGAAYKEAMDLQILKLIEGGFMEKWKKTWWPSDSRCLGPDVSSGAAVLGLDSVGGVFLLYAGVAAVALLCLMLSVAVRTLPRKAGCWAAASDDASSGSSHKSGKEPASADCHISGGIYP